MSEDKFIAEKLPHFYGINFLKTDDHQKKYGTGVHV